MKPIAGKKTVKIIAAFFLTIMVWDILLPVSAFALTGGPSQPEVQSFEPVGTSEMVDVFSGDFVYNIPLLDVEGFPINISYHSGVGMDDEASWVGLGWNINPGVISRNMRGLPDDFKGDLIKNTTNIKENKTYGVTQNRNIEFFGVDNKKHLNVGIGLTYGIFFNNYRGLGYEFSLNPSISMALKTTDAKTSRLGLNTNLSVNSQNGADVGFNLSFSLSDKFVKEEPQRKRSLSFGSSVNSRQGMQDITMSYSRENKLRYINNINKSSRFSLNSTTYTPQVQQQLTNLSINLGFSVGGEANGVYFKGGTSGYYQSQSLTNQVRYNNAYGYMYSHDGLSAYSPGVSDGNAMFDLNRENDGTFTKEKPFLPMPVFTYDLFSVAGEGTGGLIRPFRGDVGVMTDPEVNNKTIGLGIGVEVGVGNSIEVGLDLSGNYGYSKSGPWKGKNYDFDIIRHLNFAPPESASPFEPFYFRSTGEKTLANSDIYSQMGDDQPITLEVDNSATGRLNPRIIKKSGGHNSIYNKVKTSERQRRNLSVSMLTNYEAKKMALNRNIHLYERNEFKVENKSVVYDTSIARETDDKFGYKMSELNVTNPDGRRYVYGIPAYNNFQYDATFRVVDVNNPTALSKNRATGLVTYNSGDNSTGNGRGEDNYFTKNEIPAYAHSFLLTSILSADFVDITGNGVSDDDIGTAVKLNYSRAYNNYRWRTPFGKGSRQGNYDEGLKSDLYDDRANYVFGEKEIWYVHSIESKNYVACFYTSRRDDACNVLNEDGGIDTSKSFYKLDSIKLFTKESLRADSTNAIPLKTVHFEYDYSLCLNTENNRNYNPGSSALQAGTGKLTLKKIYFTYGKSKKGRTNSYQFTYNDYNPKYNLRGYDRWGNFKPNASQSDCDDIGNPSTAISNTDYPYSLQNKDSADLYSSAWSLSQIKLPSGGVINVDYESDDYAYVQDRQAGQMFKIIGCGTNSAFSAHNELYSGSEDTNPKSIFFDLAEPFSKSVSTAEKNKKHNDYFANIDKMYFKFLVDITGKGDYEYISGYADKHAMGFSSKNPSDTNYDIGYIQLKEVSLTDKKGEINPISKAAWNFMRLNAPKKLAKIYSNYEQPPGSIDPVGALRSLVGASTEMLAMLKSFGKRMKLEGAGKKFVVNKSFIRLNNPTKMKFGGGVRVKKVTLSDSWDDMVSGQEASNYGQEYHYTSEERQSDGTFRTISSGVATWEPGIGDDENPMRQPVEYSGSNTLAPDDQFMIETPIGSAFFPSPSVGYSKVTTINIKPTENIKRTGTGYVVNEFYTARDFPVIFKNTNIERKPKRNKPSVLGQFLKVYVKDKMFVSQGYSVELNDMHGKPKEQWVFEEGNSVPISGVKYNYHHKINDQGKNQLTSKVDIVGHDGSIGAGELGREIDYMFDTRNSYNFHMSGAIDLNLDAFLVGIIPAIVGTLLPSVSVSELEFGSAVNTKVITRYGILKSTEVFENGATVKTENVLFDKETGDVLLSKTTNEFTDTIYTFNYPAHFAYEGMEQAYKNIGYYFTDISIVDGELRGLSNYRNYFVPGDEMYIEHVRYNSSNNSRDSIWISPYRLWAVESPHYTDDLVFMTRTGLPFNTSEISQSGKYFKHNLKIIRSGRRNMHGASIGTVVSLNNPVKNNTLSFDSIINSGAVEFSDNWPVEHKNVYEEVEEDPGGAYTGVGPAPSSITQSRGGCNDSCYYVVYDLLLSFPTTLPSFNTLLNADLGDTINLMKPPYRDAFLCALDQTQYCPQFDFFEDIGDSLIIYDSETQYTASINEKEQNINRGFAISRNYLSTSEMYAQRGPSFPNLIEHDLPVVYEPQKNNSSSSLAWDINNPCGVCSEIRNRQAYKKRRFRLNDGCYMDVIIQCISPSSCISFPKAGPLYCSIYGELPSLVNIKTINSAQSAELNTRYGCDNAIIYTNHECPYDYANGEYNEPPKKPDGPGGGPGGSGGGSTGDGGQIICADSACGDNPYLLPINPYVYGTKGNWRPKRNWLFYNKRNQSTITNIRKDGTYKNYSDFWKKPAMTNQYWDTGTSISSKWTWNTQVTQFNKTGNEIANKDALNIYSAAIFGYGNSLVKSVGNNCKLRQIGYDGFEDYPYFTSFNEDHLSFYKHKSKLDTSRSHTGMYSISIDTSSQIFIRKCVTYLEKEADNPVTDTSVNLVMLKPTDILEQFSPDSGKYVISTWVSENVSSAQFKNYTDTVVVKIYQPGCNTIYKFTPSGPIIEGWQRLEGQFTIPDSTTCIEFTFKSNNLYRAYFDDFRIHPFNSNMKSFVYHPKTLRLVAELDENNFATFYEYDDEGRLVRIKRETERGIVTLQESRTGLKIKE